MNLKVLGRACCTKRRGSVAYIRMRHLEIALTDPITNRGWHLSLEKQASAPTNSVSLPRHSARARPIRAGVELEALQLTQQASQRERERETHTHTHTHKRICNTTLDPLLFAFGLTFLQPTRTHTHPLSLSSPPRFLRTSLLLPFSHNDIVAARSLIHHVVQEG